MDDIQWTTHPCGDLISVDGKLRIGERFRIVSKCCALLVSERIEPPYGVPYRLLDFYTDIDAAKQAAENYNKDND